MKTSRLMQMVGGVVLALVTALAFADPASLPDAPAKEVLVRACTSCHPVEQIVLQRRTADEWDQVIAIMADRGAPATEQELAQIREYLVGNFGM